ncbi:DUF2782 domain-containing protein [Methylomonas sp. SURF-2]|uniref:DUF2782 domain-containing protein n=1 Tax=Methylomonas subterranea TaxID=2952225 RepID=A0ABT1TKY6_9GAMM|nr:DUF2782 domain-containing protein [Methylomonas sp. SURF-2]MCQ8106137.1 DUF2782 domain-containing protein [Methylomonas sp. SURF-2]
MFRHYLFSLIIAMPGIALAEQALEEPPAVPEPPELPARVQSGEEMEPDITIIRKGKDTIQEFRRNGKLYMIKVQPQVGPPYYFLDKDGDGVMDVKKSDLDKNININQWLLFEWD